MDAIAIAASLLPQLVEFIANEIAAGAKDERAATHAALQHLLDEKRLEPVLPTIEADLAAARRTAAERDAGGS